MGYELHITRAESWVDNSGKKITREEYQELLRKDRDLKLAGINGPDFAVFSNASDPMRSSWLDWIAGNIDSKYPSSRMVRKMISIAEHLGAKVQGDDGEIYTLEEMHGIDDAYDKELGYE